MLNRVHLAIRSRYIIYKDHEHLHLSSKRFLPDLSMSNTASILYETGTAYHLGTPDFFGRIHVTHLFSFLCCVFCFVCFCSMCCAQCYMGLWIVHS